MAAKRKSKHRVGLDAKDLASSILIEDHPDYRSLRLFFERMRLDRNFMFVGTLLEQASESLRVFASHESPAQETAQSWQELTARSLVLAKAKGYKVHTVGEKPGQKEEYPLATPLARKVPSAPEFELLHFFRALLLLSCLDKQAQFSVTQQESIATQLGLATHPKRTRFALFRQLPRISDSPSLDSYLERIRAGFEGLIQQVDEHPDPHLQDRRIDEEQALLIRQLLILLGSRVRRRKSPSSESQKPPSTPRPQPPKPVHITINPPSIEDTDDTPTPVISGTISAVSEPLSDEDSQADPPDQIWQAEPYEPAPNEGADLEPISEEDLEATVRRSARWIFNNMQRTPVSAVRWNPIERAVFLDGLQSGPNSPSISFEATLCMGLMYCTGVPLEKVLAYKVGKDGDISPDGAFTRQWQRPSSAYQPNEELLHALGPIQHQITLALPGEIVTQLKKVVSGHTAHTPLSELLVHTTKDIDTQINTLLSQWRDRGRYRLKRERLSAALATELSVLYQDPLTVFLLAGSELHQSPTIHYYQAQPESLLQARWNGAMNALFQR